MTIEISIGSRRLGVALVVVAVSAGCSEDPDGHRAQVRRERRRAMRASAQFKEAIIEYRNALKAKPDAGGRALSARSRVSRSRAIR